MLPVPAHTIESLLGTSHSDDEGESDGENGGIGSASCADATAIVAATDAANADAIPSDAVGNAAAADIPAADTPSGADTAGTDATKEGASGAGGSGGVGGIQAATHDEEVVAVAVPVAPTREHDGVCNGDDGGASGGDMVSAGDGRVSACSGGGSGGSGSSGGSSGSGRLVESREDKSHARDLAKLARWQRKLLDAPSLFVPEVNSYSAVDHTVLHVLKYPHAACRHAYAGAEIARRGYVRSTHTWLGSHAVGLDFPGLRERSSPMKLTIHARAAPAPWS
eukprot:1124164-Pleurochrysis_carterae.AAC.1